jgi:hypothetical protein
VVVVVVDDDDDVAASLVEIPAAYVRACVHTRVHAMQHKCRAMQCCAVRPNRYWNLNGLQRTVHDHTLSLNCSRFLPVTPTQIPTGELRSVEGTDFDFKSAPRSLAVLDGVDGAGQPGFDHCLVIDRADGAEAGALVQCAEASCDGVVMRVATTKPGVQLYTVRALPPRRRQRRRHRCRRRHRRHQRPPVPPPPPNNNKQH